MRVCRSPKLIAAYHGLHRLRVPRHPPHAFTRLTTTICSIKQSAYNLPLPPIGLSATDDRLLHAQCMKPHFIECQSFHPLLDEPPPFNKDSQIRDLPLLPL